MSNIQKVIKILAICFGAFIITNIVAGVVFVLSITGNITMNNNKSFDVYEKTYMNIANLDLDLSSTSINIIRGNEFKVIVNAVEDSITIKEIEGILKIEEKNQWLFNNNSEGMITISIPENIILNKLEIDAGAGKVLISDISVNKLDLNQGAGIIKISNSDFNFIDIDGGAGEITINNSVLNNLVLDSGVGAVKINSKILGNSEISSGVGEVILNLRGSKEDYFLNLEKGLGSITIDGVDFSNNTTYGAGLNSLRVEGGIGSIKINFE